MAELIFRGVKNPANCSECFFWAICPCLADFDDYSAILDAVHDGNLVRHEECPVSPLPEGHGRLGDLDRLFEVVGQDADRWIVDEVSMIETDDVLDAIQNAPTIVPAEGGTDDDGNA